MLAIPQLSFVVKTDMRLLSANILSRRDCIQKLKRGCFRARKNACQSRAIHTSSTLCGNFSQKWQYNTSYNGALVVRSNQNCQFNVGPIDPVTYPNQDIALISHSKEAESLQVSHARNVINIEDTDDAHGRSKCDARVPIKYNVDVKLGQRAAATVSNLENDSTLIHTRYGHCILHNVKTAVLDVHTDHGTVISEKSLLANGQITATNKAGVRISKLIGENVAIMSQHGDISVRNLYVGRCFLLTENGCIHLGQTHNHVKAEISDKGNLVIDSFDGTLEAKVNEGLVDVFIQQCLDISIEIFKGNILLRVPETLNAELHINASSVMIDSSLSYESNGSNSEQGNLSKQVTLLGGKTLKDQDPSLLLPQIIPKITLTSHSGNIEIKGQSWLSSLKLG